MEALRKTGRNPTRAGVMAQLAKLNWKNPFMIPGVTVKTGRVDRFPIEQVQLTRWSVNRRGDRPLGAVRPPAAHPRLDAARH